MSSDYLKVRVVNVPVSCCGVLAAGYVGLVTMAIGVDEDTTIYVLDNEMLVWAHNCEEVTDGEEVVH
ncbi:TMhelix containing protein [Vibrio phage 1.208.B._10N.222.52.A7]|nr:TMhelix containing protein [Vibrio phage 1.208.B._10N.222.52.A7]QZI86181.1 hypothetical protein PODOV061v2_0037 [Vibrio phage 172P1]